MLGPLLFLLHVNDMPSVIDTKTTLRLFADDALIYRVIESIQDQEMFQKDLDRLQKWAETWGMVFNASKCYMMHIRPDQETQTRFYQLCGTVLSSVTSEKYLGVHIRHDFKWTQHIDQVAAAASRKLGFIRRNLRGSPKDCKKLAYISLVRSSMEYASIIWDPFTKVNSDKLERLQRKAARWVYSDYSRETSVTALLAELQWKPLQERRRIQRLAFMYKILNEKVAVPIDSVDLVFNDRPARRKDANKRKIKPLRAKTTEYQKSFIVRTIVDWNSVPESVASASSEASFKSRLSSRTP